MCVGSMVIIKSLPNLKFWIETPFAVYTTGATASEHRHPNASRQIAKPLCILSHSFTNRDNLSRDA
ncbi:MAG: hypothetical protein BroJett038_33230 [Chloroflexota bacterium]|nr:MAG: hypothetical protein BroJett038_33230 [Chloroflexota bacterium]